MWCVCVCVCSGGLVAESSLTLASAWTVAHEATLFMGFSRQEQWSGFPFPPPSDLPDLGIKESKLGLQHYRQIIITNNILLIITTYNGLSVEL